LIYGPFAYLILRLIDPVDDVLNDIAGSNDDPGSSGASDNASNGVLEGRLIDRPSSVGSKDAYPTFDPRTSWGKFLVLSIHVMVFAIGLKVSGLSGELDSFWFLVLMSIGTGLHVFLLFLSGFGMGLVGASNEE